MTYAELSKAEKFVFVIDTEAAFNSDPSLWWDFWIGLCHVIGRQVRSKIDENRKEVVIFYLISEQELKISKKFLLAYCNNL